MSPNVLGVCLSVILAAAACGHAPPPVPANRQEPGTITWPATLDHPSTSQTHRAAALQLLADSGTAAAMTAMLEVTLRQQLEIHPVLRPYEATMRAFLEKYISFDAMREDLARIYVERFPELQLRQIIAFYQTSAGRRAVQELPKLVELGAELAKKRVAEHMDELKQMMTQPRSSAGAP